MANLDPNLEQTFNSLEEEHNLPSGLLKSVAYTESRYNPNAKSPVGAAGMFQFMPATAKQYGVNVDDPVSSAQGAAKMYADLLKMNGGDLPKALAGYNWGQGNLNKKGFENAPKETQNYINQITGLMGQKKSSINIPPEAMEAYNSYVAQAKGKETMATDNNIPPEALEAYNSYVNQASQPQQAQSDIPPEAMEAYNAYVSQNSQPQQVAQPAPIQTPVQTAQSNTSFGIVNAQDTLNAQSANIQYQPQENHQLAIYKTAIDKARQGVDLTPLWASLNDREKKEFGSLLRGAYQQDGENRGIIENLWQGLTNSAQKGNQAIEQIGSYALSKATGNKKYINDKNAEIAKTQAAKEMLDVVDPSVARTIGEVGGDIAQFAGGEGIIRAGMTAAQKAVPGLIIKGAGALPRAADLAVQGGGAAVLQNPANPNGDFINDKLTQAGIGAVVTPAVGAAVNKIGQKVIAGKLSPDDELAKISGDIKELVPSDYIAKKGLDKVAADNTNRFSNAAKESIEKLNKVDINDPSTTLKTLAEANHLTKKIENDAQYKEVARLAPKGDQYSVPLTSTQKELDNIIAKANTAVSPDAKATLQPIIKNVTKAIEDGKLDYVRADKLFQEFGDKVGALKANNPVEAQIYRELRSAINKDKDDFVKSLPNNPELQAYKTSYENAKTTNKLNIQDVKSNNMLNKLMEPYTKRGVVNLPDNLIDSLVKKGQTDKVKVLYNSLDEEGKNAVASGVLNKLVNTASKDGSADPKAFIKAFKAYEDPSSGNTPLNVVFDAPTLTRLKDLMHIFDTATKQTSLVKNAAGLALDLVTPKAISSAFSLLKNLGAVKALGNKDVSKIILSIKNTNPNSQKYLSKVSDLIGIISGQQATNKIK